MNVVEAVAALLSDPGLRATFRDDRAAWIKAVGVDADEAPTLQALDLEELETQAGLLIDKRAGEVAELIPRTRAGLGSRFEPLFADYAAGAPWPRGHLRHLRDATRFLRFLQARAPAAVSGVDQALLRSQLAWRQGRRLSFGLSHHRDTGPLSGLVLVLATRRGKLRLTLPLPFPASLGRRSW